jgi:hypothetical protein
MNNLATQAARISLAGNAPQVNVGSNVSNGVAKAAIKEPVSNNISRASLGPANDTNASASPLPPQPPVRLSSGLGSVAIPTAPSTPQPASTIAVTAPRDAKDSKDGALSPLLTTISLEKKKRSLKVIITKTEHGIGLDLIKTIDGGVSVQRLKDMPDGSPNPASICSPPVSVGDIIVGVNDSACTQFIDVVKAIRGSSVKVCLWLERYED